MTRTPRLNDLQLVLLSHAAKSDVGTLFPLPASVTDDERTRRDLAALLKRGLVAECEHAGRGPAWRESDDGRIGLVLTNAGRTAIGLDEDSDAGAADTGLPTAAMTGDAGPPAPAVTRRDLILGLLTRAGGATLADMTAATGWLPHSARAFLTGLRKQGHAVSRERIDGVTRYAILEAQ
jgi:hypothetical protein